MKFGVAVPNYGSKPSKREIVDVANAAEELGYDSIWTTDHTLMSKQFAYPYGNIMESIVTLTFIGAKTSSIRLGTSILSLPLRNPISVAKQAATLDVLSGGRLILGVGVGGGEDDVYEFRYLRANYKNRGSYVDESLKIIKTLWMQDEPHFRGEYFSFSNCVFLPKPVQRALPVWVGGASRAAVKRACVEGDGWHPTGITPQEYENCSRLIDKLSKGKKIVRSGRYLVRPIRRGEDILHEPFHTIQGTREKVVGLIEEFRNAGMEHMTCYFGDEGYSKTLARLKLFAKEVAISF